MTGKFTYMSVIENQEYAESELYDATNSVNQYDPSNWDLDDPDEAKHYEDSKKEAIKECEKALEPVNCMHVSFNKVPVVRLTQDAINRMFPQIEKLTSAYNMWVVIGEAAHAPGHIIITPMNGGFKEYGLETMMIHDGSIEIVPPTDC